MNNNDERIVSTNEISDDSEIEYGLRPKRSANTSVR